MALKKKEKQFNFFNFCFSHTCKLKWNIKQKKKVSTIHSNHLCCPLSLLVTAVVASSHLNRNRR